MTEKTPVAGRQAPQCRQPNAPFRGEGRGTLSQIEAKLLFHASVNSRNFPIREAEFVGNIPFAFGTPKSDKSVMEKNELRQRIRNRLTQLGLGAVEATQAVPGLERNYLRDFLEGKKNSFSSAKQPLVADALKWTIDELIGAPGKRTDRATPKMALVPLLDQVTAGRLRAPSSQIPVEDVPLLAFADLGRGEFFALRVEGDSMDRYSPEGATVVVNKADRTLISGKCYIFALRGETTYKMWQGGENPHLAPYSTNPSNKPIFFKKKSDLEVIGRVKKSLLDL